MPWMVLLNRYSERRSVFSGMSCKRNKTKRSSKPVSDPGRERQRPATGFQGDQPDWFRCKLVYLLDVEVARSHAVEQVLEGDERLRVGQVARHRNHLAALHGLRAQRRAEQSTAWNESSPDRRINDRIDMQQQHTSARLILRITMPSEH